MFYTDATASLEKKWPELGSNLCMLYMANPPVSALGMASVYLRTFLSITGTKEKFKNLESESFKFFFLLYLLVFE